MEALVLAGPRASGKTTVGRALEQTGRFKVVPAVTTRPARKDDQAGQYSHISDSEFDALPKGGLLTNVSYAGHRYALTAAAVTAARKGGVTPVLVVTPDAAESLAQRRDEKSGEFQFVTVFLESSDDELDRRLNERGDKSTPQARAKQRKQDRTLARQCTYVLVNREIESTVEAVKVLWDFRRSSGILPSRVTKALLACDCILVNWSEKSIKGASYDLRLGDEYFQHGNIQRLGEDKPFLVVEPYDYAIVTTAEECSFPSDLAGRFDLSVKLFQQGMILSNGTQVDPGFHGRLTALLFNTSSSRVMLKRAQHLATLELHKMAEPTQPYAGGNFGKTLLDYLPANAATGAVHELKKEIDELKGQNRLLLDLTWALLAFFVAIVTLIVGLR